MSLLADGRNLVDRAGVATGGQDEPLRVVVDLRWMRPGVAGGIENLARSFLDQLLRLDRFNRYTVLVPSEARHDVDAGDHPNFTFTVDTGPGAYARRVARASARRLGISDQRRSRGRTPRWIQRLGVEVALSMPGYIHPDVAALPNVLVVPDIQHEYHPEFFAPSELAERRRAYTVSAKRAAHICAISEFTRRTLIERVRIPAGGVTTIYPAADPTFHPGSAGRGNARRVVEKYDLPAGEYLLFPGNTWPHKNHRAAVQALHLLREASGLRPVLVCTGTPKAAHDELLRQISELRLEGQVRFLGYCSTDDMPGLYEGAAALVYPSLFEGFGIPLLEAMWCDCPVVCSNVTSLPEVAGGAALLVDPRSPEALAGAVRRVLTDAELRRDLIERGRRRASQFSWETFTRETVRILREACHG